MGREINPIIESTEEAYQKLQEAAKTHNLLEKLKTEDGNLITDLSELDAVLKEVASFHVRANKFSAYLGTSVGYMEDYGEVYLNSQYWSKRVMSEPPRSAYERLHHEFSMRLNRFKMNIWDYGTHHTSPDSKFNAGPKAFEPGPVTPSGVIHVVDLVAKKDSIST